MATAKNLLLGSALTLVVIAYHLYCPIPDGYSTTTGRQLKMTLSLIKALDDLVRSVLFSSYNYLK